MAPQQTLQSETCTSSTSASHVDASLATSVTSWSVHELSPTATRKRRKTAPSGTRSQLPLPGHIEVPASQDAQEGAVRAGDEDAVHALAVHPARGLAGRLVRPQRLGALQHDCLHLGGGVSAQPVTAQPAQEHASPVQDDRLVPARRLDPLSDLAEPVLERTAWGVATHQLTYA